MHLAVLAYCYFVIRFNSLHTGEVYAKDRHTGRAILKNEEPFGYCSAMVIYFGLSIALVFFFYLSSNGESTGQIFANIFS